MRTFRPDSESSISFAAAIALLFTSLQNFERAFLQTIPQYWTMLHPEQFQNRETHISQIFPANGFKSAHALANIYSNKFGKK